MDRGVQASSLARVSCSSRPHIAVATPERGTILQSLGQLDVGQICHTASSSTLNIASGGQAGSPLLAG
jgi:hypothetical protein